MRLVGYLFFMMLLTNCNSQGTSENIRIHYEAYTRGNSVTFEVTSKEINYRDSEKNKKIKMSSNLWENITALIKKANVSKISSYKAPSEERILDKALYATLTVYVGDKKFTSQTFDHGNPPRELKPILDKLFQVLEIK